MKGLYPSLALLLLLSACGSGASATKTDSGGKTTSEAPTSERSRPEPQAVTFPKGVEPARVSLLEFSPSDRKLFVGFEDGHFATVEVESGEKTMFNVAKGAHPVAAATPDGSLVLIGSTPPAIVNLEGELVLQMNVVNQFESARFAPGGLILYVSDKTGKLRVWGQAHSFEEDQHKEKLEIYLNRQAPDFHVQFGPLRGPVYVTPDNAVVVVDQEGVVSVWSLTSPESSRRIMKLDGTVRSLDSDGAHVFATSEAGSLKVGVLDPPGYLPWSRDARAELVAASPAWDGKFVTLEKDKLVARNTQDGTPVWETEVPGGVPCGLAVSADGNYAAACIDGHVAIVHTDDGRPASLVYKTDALHVE